MSGPLPAGWREFVDDRGNGQCFTYWANYNLPDRPTTWIDPRLGADPATSSQAMNATAPIQAYPSQGMMNQTPAPQGYGMLSPPAIANRRPSYGSLSRGSAMQVNHVRSASTSSSSDPPSSQPGSYFAAPSMSVPAQQQTQSPISPPYQSQFAPYSQSQSQPTYPLSPTSNPPGPFTYPQTYAAGPMNPGQSYLQPQEQQPQPQYSPGLQQGPDQSRGQLTQDPGEHAKSSGRGGTVLNMALAAAGTAAVMMYKNHHDKDKDHKHGSHSHHGHNHHHSKHDHDSSVVSKILKML